MSPFRLFAGAVALSLSAMSWAHSDSPRPDHYAGKASETLEQAVVNLKQSNDQLQGILAKGDLKAVELNQVHQLTYTLENALEKIRDELETSAELLEEVHQASEKNDAGKVRKYGADYLKITGAVVK